MLSPNYMQAVEEKGGSNVDHRRTRPWQVRITRPRRRRRSVLWPFFRVPVNVSDRILWISAKFQLKIGFEVPSAAPQFTIPKVCSVNTIWIGTFHSGQWKSLFIAILVIFLLKKQTKFNKIEKNQKFKIPLLISFL